MADLAITAASVVPGADASIRSGRAGEAVTAGKVVYLDSASKAWKLADNDAVLAEAHKAVGIALNGASNGQPIDIQTAGSLTIGATLVAGTDYYLSATPGGICPRADLGTGKAVCLIGLAASTSVLNVGIEYPGVTL
jgi:hypothetical protein